MNTQLFSAFLLITFVLVVVPGPIVTLVIATGATRGTRAALLTVAGSTAGNALLISGIALGLGSLSRTRRRFSIICAGSAPPIWSGSASRPGGTRGEGAAVAPPRGHVYFRRGFLAAITNPKTIAFFTAFLPQFVDPALPAGHIVVMCSVAIAMATLTDCAGASSPARGAASS